MPGLDRIASAKVLVSAVCAAAALVGTPGSAHAQTDPLKVTAGFDGRYVPGAKIPVRVTVTADRLISGSLEVSYPREGEPRVRIPVEVAGGSVKEYVIVVPTSMDGTVPSNVVLEDGGHQTRQRIGDLSPLVDAEIVGVLPTLLAAGPPPGPAPLTAETGTARFTVLDDALLAQAPASLESVTVIALGPQDLERMGPRTRDAVLRWVGLGGVLYVDSAPGPVEGLPQAWQPVAGDVVAGAGRIRVTEGAMGEGRWSGLVEATSRAARTPGVFAGGEFGDFARPGEMGRVFGFGGLPFVNESLAETIALDAGLRAPRLGWLYLLLIAYTVLVGPVTFVVLRRRRRAELAWIAVPLVAVVFTAGSYASGMGLRQRRAAHATVMVTGEWGATAQTTFGTSGSGGAARIGFAGGWTPAASSERLRRAPTFTLGPDGPEAGLDLSPGEFATVTATGPAEAGGGLVVEAASEGERIAGTVRNSTPWTLREVRVFVGKNWSGVGDLSAGESRGFEMAASPTAAHWVLPGQEAWDQQAEMRFRRGAGFPEGFRGPVAYALWQATTTLPWGDPLAPGRVLAAGWTDEYTPQVTLGGRPAGPRGRTLVLSRAPLGYGSGPLDPLDVFREEVRGTQFLGPEPGWDEIDPGGGPLVMRFTLPREPQAPLVLSVPSSTESVEVWVEGTWRRVDMPEQPDPIGPPGPGGPQVIPQPFEELEEFDDFRLPRRRAGEQFDVELPALTGDVAYVRVLQHREGSSVHAGWAFDLREAR